jgi:hypothetical protein
MSKETAGCLMKPEEAMLPVPQSAEFPTMILQILTATILAEPLIYGRHVIIAMQFFLKHCIVLQSITKFQMVKVS